MKTTNDVLNAIKKHNGLTSDYQLAKFLKTGHPNISNYRNGRSHPDNIMAFKMAEALGKEPLELIAIFSAERAKKAEEKTFWQGIAKHAAGMAASVAAVAVIMAGLAAGGYSELNQGFESVKQASFDPSKLYIIGNSLLVTLLVILAIIPGFSKGKP